MEGSGIVVGAFLACAVLAYHFVVRPWHLRWGTTADETTRSLPGDDFAPADDRPTTHAVGINAAAKDVWPWIVQIGQQRGGFYSYTWLENLVGCRMKNADRIVPEWQRLEVGDDIWLHPKAPPLKVVALEPERALVLGGRSERSIFSWVFVLEQLNENHTRLIVRGKGHWGMGWFEKPFNYFIDEPAHFIMERKMLLEVKRLAESESQFKSLVASVGAV
jgi:hypothetical protein